MLGSMPWSLRTVALATAITVLAVLAGVAAFLAGRALAPAPERVATVLDTPQDVSDLELEVASSGERVDLATLASQADWTLVFFGFVDCPDVCPLTMARLAETYVTLGEPDALQVAMITVDPDRDEGPRLANYVQAFHPSFVGLRGSSQDVAAAARRFFVGYSGTGTEIVHTEAVGLVDAQGRLRAVYGSSKIARIGDDLVDLLAGSRL